MKKLGITVLLSALLFAGCSNATEPSTTRDDNDKLKVYTTIYPIHDFTSKLVGDLVELEALIPSGQTPHDWEPSAGDVLKLEQADVLIYNGSGLEPWLESVVESLENKDLVLIEATKGMELMEGSDHEHDHDEKDHDEEDHDEEDHDHPVLDPHVWTSPVLAKQQMEILLKGLQTVDPKNAEHYAENFTKYAALFDQLDESYRLELKDLSRRDLVVAHEAYGYMAKQYNLNQVGIEGINPDSEPDPARMAEIIDFVKEHDVKVIFFEEFVNPKVAESIAAQTGAQTMVLNPIEGLTQEQVDAEEDYFSIMKSNLDALKSALK